MSDPAKLRQLAQGLRDTHAITGFGDGLVVRVREPGVLSDTMVEAAATIERLTKENERLTQRIAEMERQHGQ